MNLDYMGSVQALLALPSAIQSLKELLATRTHNTKELSSALDGIKSTVANFSLAHSWILEAKLLHDHVSVVVASFDLLNLVASKSMRNNAFVSGGFDYDECHMMWKAVRGTHINMLLSCMKGLKTFGDENLVVINGTQTPVAGRHEFVRFAQSVIDLDKAFDVCQPSDPRSCEKIIKLVCLLDVQLKALLFEINAEIRSRAEAVADVLKRLHGRLVNV